MLHVLRPEVAFENKCLVSSFQNRLASFALVPHPEQVSLQTEKMYNVNTSKLVFLYCVSCTHFGQLLFENVFNLTNLYVIIYQIINTAVILNLYIFLFIEPTLEPFPYALLTPPPLSS